MMTSFPVIYLFYNKVIISREHLKRSTCQGNLLQRSIITIAVGAWFEKNLKVCFFEENHYRPTLLKVAIYCAVLVSVIFVEKMLLNAQKYLQLSHAFI